MLLGALDASLSGNLFTGKVVPAGDGVISELVKEQYEDKILNAVSSFD